MTLSKSCVALTVCIAYGTVCPLAGSGTARDVTLAYELPDRVTLHEPIVLDIVIDNASGHPVGVHLGWHRVGNFHLTLVKPNGDVVSPRSQDPEGVAPLDTFSIEPSTRHTQWMVLNAFFDFDTAGQYELGVQFSGTIRAATDAMVRADRSRTLSITILPRDEATLRTTCNRLAAIATQSMNAERSMRAATALAWTVDPVAVPWLRDVAQSSRAQYEAIVGLGRIGNPQAREVLESLTFSHLPDVAAAARAQLRRLAMRR